MSRVELAETVLEPQGRVLAHVDGAQVTVSRRGGGQAQLFTTATGSATITQPLTTNVGRIEPVGSPGGDVWVDPGAYDLEVIYGERTWTQKADIPSARLSDSPAIERIKDWLLAPSVGSSGAPIPAGWRRALEIRKPTGASRIPGGVELYDGQFDAVADPTGSGPDPEGMIQAANDRRFNTTSAGMTLHFWALLAQLEPGKQRDLLAHIDRLGVVLINHQHKDPNLLNRGGFKVGANDSHASSFGAGIIGRALLAAHRATDNPGYFVAARNTAEFLLRMYDPNAHWPAKYGVPDPINRTVGGVTYHGFCERVDNADKLATMSGTWNLIAARFLAEINDFMGAEGDEYGVVADAVMGFLDTGVTDGYDYFAPQANIASGTLTAGINTSATVLDIAQDGPVSLPVSYPFTLIFRSEQMTVTGSPGAGQLTVTRGSVPVTHSSGERWSIADTYVSVQWPNATSHLFNNHGWHRAGDVANTGTIGTDGIEYGLASLYAMGYPVEDCRTIYEYWRDLTHSGALHIASENPGPDYTFGEAYDGGFCFTGYMRAGNTIADGAFPGGFRPTRPYGRYYDFQGACTLGPFKALEYPVDFAKSLRALEQVIYRGSLLGAKITAGTYTGDYETVYSAATGYDYATKGVIPIASAGLALVSAIAGIA